MSYFNKEVNAQKESLKKILRGSRKLPQAHEKVCDENQRKKKQWVPKIFVMEGRSFIRCMRKTDIMDIKQFQVNDS